MSDIGLFDRRAAERIRTDDSGTILAAIHYERDFDINAMLREIVDTLRRCKVRVGGVLQDAKWLPNEGCARLHIVDILTGHSECITQNRGTEAQGCKLDPRGLAAISYRISDAIASKADLIVINKFGRAESEGRGLLSCFAEAVIAGIPLLTTVREPYVAQWSAFHGGLAVQLPASQVAQQWLSERLHSAATIPKRPDRFCWEVAVPP